MAIASLNLRPAGTGQGALAMLVNRGAVFASGKVHLSADGRPQEAKTFQLKPEEAASFLWSDLPGAYRWRQSCRLTIQEWIIPFG